MPFVAFGRPDLGLSFTVPVSIQCFLMECIVEGWVSNSAAAALKLLPSSNLASIAARATVENSGLFLRLPLSTVAMLSFGGHVCSDAVEGSGLRGLLTLMEL